MVRLIVRQQDQYNFGVGVPIAKAHRPGDGVVGSPTSSPPQIEPFYSHRKIGNQDPITIRWVVVSTQVQMTTTEQVWIGTKAL